MGTALGLINPSSSLIITKSHMQSYLDNPFNDPASNYDSRTVSMFHWRALEPSSSSLQYDACLFKSQAHTLQNTQATHQYTHGTSQGYSAIPLHSQADYRNVAPPDLGSAGDQRFVNSQWDGSRYKQGSAWINEQKKQTHRTKIVVGGTIKITDRA